MMMDDTMGYCLLVMAPRSGGGQMSVGSPALYSLGQRLPLKLLEKVGSGSPAGAGYVVVHPGCSMLDILQFVLVYFRQRISGARSILYHWSQELLVGFVSEIGRLWGKYSPDEAWS